MPEQPLGPLTGLVQNPVGGDALNDQGTRRAHATKIRDEWNDNPNQAQRAEDETSEQRRDQPIG